MTLQRALLSSGPVFALASFAFGGHSVSRGPDLYLNGVHVLTFRTGNPSGRAATAARMLRESPSTTVSIGKSRRSTTIRLGNSVLAAISKAEAAAAGSTPAGLAAAWAANVRTAFALPPVKVLGPSARVPLGGTRSLRLVGSKAHLATWRTSPPGFVTVRRDEGGLTLQGRALAQGTLHLTAGAFQIETQVDVQPLAAAFPQNLSANVSGLPAQRDMVVGSLEAAIRTKMRMHPEARVQMQIPDQSSLDPGLARVVDVYVKVEAPGAFPAEGVARVTVRNLGLGPTQEEELWYSNHPENLVMPGPLMSGVLSPERPVRLLYHHINESPTGLYVQVEAANTNGKLARLMVIPGDSEPDRNPVLAGIVAGERFLKRWLAGSGEVLEIPPGMRVPLALRRLAPKETMSGLCSLWLLEGGPENLSIRVFAYPPSSPEANLAALINRETPWRSAQPAMLRPSPTLDRLFEHVYPEPFKLEELKHSVGGKYGFVRIGQNPISRQDQNGSLDGNFGVLYRIASYAENPTDSAVDLEVAFEASAGYSGALFVLNGEVIRTPLLHPKKSARIVRMHLGPGQAKRFDLLTMPLSGSSYPATIVMRPIEAGNRPDADLSTRWQNKL